MGAVYRARDTSLDRDVAVKVLPPSFTADANRVARFEREAKVVAALSHPNIVAIYGFGTSDGVTYAAMELLEGRSLREHLDDGPLPLRKAVDIARQVAIGLDAAHARGIVHRDLKPDNVFVTPDGRARILDFGLARTSAMGEGDSSDDSGTRTRLTNPGTVVGTAGYMSPEHGRRGGWPRRVFRRMAVAPAASGCRAAAGQGTDLHGSRLAAGGWRLIVADAASGEIREIDVGANALLSGPIWAGNDALIYAKSSSTVSSSPDPNRIMRYGLGSQQERTLLWKPYLFPLRGAFFAATRINTSAATG